MGDIFFGIAMGFLAAFIAASVAIWKMFPVRRNFNQTGDGRWVPSWHNLAAYEMSPHVGFVCATRWTEPVYNYGVVSRCRSNRLGFWMDHEIDFFRPYVKGNREKTVVLTGGSAAMGWGASCQESLLASVLESSLNRADPGHTYRVFNFAMGGWIAFQELIALQLYAASYRPDIVILFDGRNDIVMPTRHREPMPASINYTQGKLAYDLIQGINQEPPAPRLLSFLNRMPESVRHNFLVRQMINEALLPFVDKSRRIVKTFSRIAARPRVDAVNRNSPVDLYIHAAQFYLRSVEAVTRAFPESIIMGVVQPSSLWTEDRESQALEQIRSGLRDLAERQGRFDFQDFSTEWNRDLFIDDCHMNDAGQKHFAERLCPLILQNLSGDTPRGGRQARHADAPAVSPRREHIDRGAHNESCEADSADAHVPFVYPLY